MKVGGHKWQVHHELEFRWIKNYHFLICVMELIFSMGFFIFFSISQTQSNYSYVVTCYQSFSSPVGPWSSKSKIPNHNRPFLLQIPTTPPYSMFLLSLPLQYSATSLSLRFLFFCFWQLNDDAALAFIRAPYSFLCFWATIKIIKPDETSKQ